MKKECTTINMQKGEMAELIQQTIKPVVVPAVSLSDRRASEPLMTSPSVPPPDACEEVLQHFGWWQIRTLLVVGLVKIPSAWQMASILFTAPTPAPHQYWCARPPGFEHLDGSQWKNFSHVKNKGKHDSCNVYQEVYEMANLNSDWSMLSVPENATVQTCSEFEYNTTSTFISEWHLVCSRQVLVNISQLLYLLGVLVGGITVTRLIQKTNPRSLILGGMVLQILAGLGVANSPNFELQAFLRFVTALACTTMFSAGYIICVHNCGKVYKSVVAASYEFFWSFGVMTLALLGYLTGNWRDLQYTITVPTAAILLLYKWIPSSPRWLINHDEPEAARELLEEVLRVNGHANTKVHALNPPVANRWKWKKQISWHLFIALHVAWAVTVVTYYGALLNVKNLGRDLHVNTAVAGVAEVAGVLLGIVILLRAKHMWITLGFIKLLGGCACCLSWLIPLEDDETWGWSVFLMLAMLGRIAIACSLTLLTTKSDALIPPSLLQSWAFTTVTFARVCLLSAPFIGSLAMFKEPVPLTVFGALTITGGIAAFFLEPKQSSGEDFNQSISSRL